MYRMGAVLHFRICKGCLVGHGHSHLHSCGSGGHSHLPGTGHNGLSDDEILSTAVASVNGYEPLPTERHSDVPLLNNADDDEVAEQLSDMAEQRSRSTTNVNIRAAMIHVIGDLIQSFGVFTAAIIILVKVCQS